MSTAIRSVPDPSTRHENLRVAYTQISTTYVEIDNFRAKLLSMLPLGTGAGIAILLTLSKENSWVYAGYLPPLGLFGVIVTIGLMSYELYGIKKCTAIIWMGKVLERELGVIGMFTSRPDGLFGVVNELFATAFIYPAVLAAWSYLALLYPPQDWSVLMQGMIAGDKVAKLPPPQPAVASLGALSVFILGCVLVLLYDLSLRSQSLKYDDSAAQNPLTEGFCWPKP